MGLNFGPLKILMGPSFGPRMILMGTYFAPCINHYLPNMLFDTSPNPGDEVIVHVLSKQPPRQKRCPQTTLKGSICRLRCVVGKERCRIHLEQVKAPEVERFCRVCYQNTGFIHSQGLISFYHAVGEESYLCEVHFSELCASASRYVI